MERYHLTFRELFLNEINLQTIHNIEELNVRLWVWVEQIYHKRPHSGLNNQTPLTVWQQDLIHIQPLGSVAQNLDIIFCHRFTRHVRKDGTISWDGQFFEVPYELSGHTVKLVVDPHAQKALWVESADGNNLGAVALLDVRANLHRYPQSRSTNTSV